jgi:hypothetical protein
MSIKTVLHRLNRRDQAILPSFSKFSKIIFISFLIFLASKVITYISAQTADTPPIVQYQQAIKEGNNQEAWLDNALSANAVSIFSGFYGEIPADYYDYYKKTGVIPSFIPGGIVGKSAKTGLCPRCWFFQSSISTSSLENFPKHDLRFHRSHFCGYRYYDYSSHKD